MFVREQVASLRALGHHVDVEVVAQSRGRRDYLLAIPRVRRRARQGDYDLVHIHYGLTALAARFVGGLPRVVTFHGRDVFVGWQRWFTRLGLSDAQTVYTSRRLADLAGDPTAPVIACGADPALFAPGPQAAARAALGITHDEPIVLFGASPANHEKGYPLFRAVLARIRAQGMPVHELVLPSAGLPRAQVPAAFNAADVLLLTSQKGTETGPLVVKEATLTNLPVVATDVGDVPSVLAGVSHSVCAPWPSPWRPNTWGSAAARAQLVQTLADEVVRILASRPRSNGRDFAHRVALAAKAEEVVALYRTILSNSHFVEDPGGTHAP